MSENFAQLLEETTSKLRVKPGTIIDGTVIEIRNDAVVINAGMKSEGIVPIEQFLNPQGEIEVQLGDTVEVYLDAFEDGRGETRLSREKAKRAKAWELLKTSYESEEKVVGMVTGKVKGGFTVELQDIRAFLPGSLVDSRPVRDTLNIEGKELEFKIIKIDQKRNNVVVSRRAILDSENMGERGDVISKISEGSVIKGIVKNLTDYGAFLDLGGIDGLLHITDMSWKRVKNPSDIVEIGSEIEVKVLKLDTEKNRVSLGLKQLGADPWSGVKERYTEGKKFTAKVSNITDYGCFVSLEDGIEGLVHVSEMDWTNKNANPSKIVSLGQEAEVIVLDIDEERRRISLGMKQCQQNPWTIFEENNTKGDIIEGKIKSITDFGIFIGLDGNIDGLVHLSDISWNVPGEEAVRNYKKGDSVKTVLLLVDSDRERISLGIKQLEKDLVAEYMKQHKKNDNVQGVIKNISSDVAVVELSDKVEAELHVSEFSTEKLDSLENVLNVGDTLEAVITDYDKNTKKIMLSVIEKDAKDVAEQLKEYSHDSAKTSLGDVINEQISDKEEK
jgi:small subunit ribosomal protein S1